MAEQQRVSDEQLTAWEQRREYLCFDQKHWDLIADLRASRAREALIVAELTASLGREFDAKAEATRYYERGLEFVREAKLTAAERDEVRANWQAEMARVGELQDAVERQRGLYEREHNTVHELQVCINKARALTVRTFIGPARFKAEGYERTVREIGAALTGVEGTDHG